MVKSATLRLAVVTATLLLCTACGGGGKPAGSGGLQAADSSFTEPMGSLESAPPDAIAELDALACPEVVDGALWAELKEALEKALCRAGTCAPPSGLSAESTSGGPQVAALQKTISTPPTGDTNRVNDLSIADNGDGTFTLTWHYRNLGDYDQNGTVGIEDITPLAEHFGETVPETDAERDSIQAVIDGSGNERVGIEDVTPIAQYYNTEVDHYLIEGAEAQTGPWAPVSEVAQDTGTGEERLVYSEIIQSPAALWHRIVPYDAEGTPGEPSNAVLRPSNEPIIYEVTPTEGYQHEECTFTATATGVEPLTYTWDFGGGAEPNTSSEASPTVTLADAGEYEAVLTVTNPYDETSFPFSLTVSERNEWVHTWGGEHVHGSAFGLLFDSSSFYVAGDASSDALLMKFALDGSLQWAHGYGGEGYDGVVGMFLDADGNIVAGGQSYDLGEGNTDLLLLKYSPYGELLKAMTWGTSDYEYSGRSSLAADTEGNLYLCGKWVVYGGESLALVVKFDSDWRVLWAKLWGGTSSDRALAITASGGGIYICGDTASFGAPEDDAFILKMSGDGNIVWARTWGTDRRDVFYSVAVGDDGSVYAVGNSSGSGDLVTSIMAKYSPDGSLEVMKGWHADVRNHLTCVSLDAFGNVIAVGADGETGLIVLELDKDLAFIGGKAWITAKQSESPNSIAYDAEKNLYLAGSALTPTGSWSDLSDSTFAYEGATQEVEGTVWDIAGVTNEPEGTQTSPDMVKDAVSNSASDPLVLLIKNYPR